MSSRLAVLCGVTMLSSLSAAAPGDALPELDCLVEPFQIIDVGSAHGIVKSVDVDRSDAVAADEILVRLDTSEQQAKVRQARARANMNGDLKAREAAVAFAERKQTRIQSLFASEAISSHQRDEVETELEMARMQLRQAREARDLARLDFERAKVELDNRIIRSPVAGIVVERYVAPGEFVNDTPLLRIAQMDPLRVEAIAPATLFGSVRPGMQARVTTETGNAEPLTAQVTVVDRLIDPASGTFGIRLELPNPDYAIPSGLNCRLRLEPLAIVAEESVPAVAVATPTNVNPARATSTPEAVSAVAAAELSNQPTVCLTLGPIEGDAAGTALRAALAGGGVKVTDRSDTRSQIIGHFVLTRREASLAAAKATAGSLRERGINDLAVLTRPPYDSRVSLGLFKDRNGAMAHQAELDRLDLGFATEVLPRVQRRVARWLEVTGPASAFVDRPWSAIAPELDATPCAGAGYVADAQPGPG